MKKLARTKRNSGMTLVETVVAMVVIVIISVGALTTTGYCIKLSKSSSNTNFFVREIDSYLQCYRKDGFSTDNKSALAFFCDGNIGAQRDSFEEYTAYTFYYDRAYTRLNILTGVSKASFIVEIYIYNETASYKDGFFAKAYSTITPSKNIYELPSVFYRVESYK